MNIIGIETSCDETSVAIISDGELKSNLISSQEFHKNFGGVIPELSSRAHLQMILPLVKQSLSESGIEKERLDVVCATAGPGLIGALLVGLNFAKGFAYSLNKPFIPVNHIEGHIFSGFLMEDKPIFPVLTLAVSGGHTLLLLAESENKIIKLGSTIDDAAGEAFDKTAKMLGLNYPGGPLIQKYAESGNPNAVKFPVARTKGDYDFSFSGLKTAVLRYIKANYDAYPPESDLPDIAASFTKAIVEALTRRIIAALNEFEINSVSLVGGVAANLHIRNAVREIGEKFHKKVVIPDLEYCGDNAAMIAGRGGALYKSGAASDLKANAYARIPNGWFSEREY